jgi:hypothetical protein
MFLLLGFGTLILKVRNARNKFTAHHDRDISNYGYLTNLEPDKNEIQALFKEVLKVVREVAQKNGFTYRLGDIPTSFELTEFTLIQKLNEMVKKL